MSTFREYVSKFYKMNPSTEDIFTSGFSLANGMIVLIEDSLMREHTDEDRARAGYEGERNDYDLQRLEDHNRWCLVTQLRTERHHDQVIFVAIYPDGTKKARRYGQGHEWLYKLNCTGDAPLIVSEEEWEDMNAEGLSRDEFEAMSPTEQAEVMGEEDDRPYTITEYKPIFRAQVAYLVCGDFTGEEWCHTVMSHHLDKGDIVGYEHLNTVVGAWGMSSVLFTFDFESVDDKEGWDNVRTLAEGKILHMVGDTDYTLIDIGILNPPPSAHNL